MKRAFLVAMFVALTISAAPAVAASSSTAQTVAKAGALQLSDFPSGWKQSARGSDSEAQLDARAAKISSCKPFVAFAKANRQNPRAKSPNFDLAQSNVVNTVSVYPSTAKAVATMRTFTDARFPRCLNALFDVVFRAQLAKDKTVAKQLRSVKSNITRTAGVAIGDDAVAYQGTVVVELTGTPAQNIGLGFITVRVGSALAGYSYTSTTDISSVLPSAIDASINRLRGAQSGA